MGAQELGSGSASRLWSRGVQESRPISLDGEGVKRQCRLQGEGFNSHGQVTPTPSPTPPCKDLINSIVQLLQDHLLVNV
jgi:hypothetical protein